jgi:hypothetical protein
MVSEEGKMELWVFKIRMLRRVFGLKKEKVSEGWRKSHMSSILIFNHHQVNHCYCVISRRMRQLENVPPRGEISIKPSGQKIRREETNKTSVQVEG